MDAEAVERDVEEVTVGPPGPAAGDLAQSPAANPGPPPVARAVLGLLIGAAAGALAALLTPRPDRARRQAALARAADPHR
jgi:hypothetical protein